MMRTMTILLALFVANTFAVEIYHNYVSAIDFQSTGNWYRDILFGSGYVACNFVALFKVFG